MRYAGQSVGFFPGGVKFDILEGEHIIIINANLCIFLDSYGQVGGEFAPHLAFQGRAEGCLYYFGIQGLIFRLPTVQGQRRHLAAASQGE